MEAEKDDKILEEIRRNLEGKVSTDRREKIASATKSLDWKDENEVKDYLNNLYIEYSFQCLSEKKADGCHRLANFLENIRSQYQEATELYKRNCDDYKYPRSCLVYSKNTALGRGCNKNFLESCRYSFTACDLDMAEGCLNAGICLSEEVGGLSRNANESLKYFNKACDAGNSIACIKLFEIFIRGKYDIKRDPPKAFEYAKKACEYNDLYGCVNASIMCRKGDGIKQDKILADEYRNKAEELKQQSDQLRNQPQIVFGEQHK
jgi:cytochrome c oxidase assembly factor 7